MDFYTRNYLRVLIFSPVIILSSLGAEHASARGGGAPNGCENGCNINEVVLTSYQWNGSMVLTFQNGTTSWLSNVLSSGPRTGQPDNNAIPPITMDEIIVIGEKIVDPNEEKDDSWYLQTLDEIDYWLTRKLGKGLKKARLKFFKEMIERLFGEDEEDILYNYCDTRVEATPGWTLKGSRQNFVYTEFLNGNVNFNDIPTIPGASDELNVVFANGAGTYVHDLMAFYQTGQIVQELNWIYLQVGCGQ